MSGQKTKDKKTKRPMDQKKSSTYCDVRAVWHSCGICHCQLTSALSFVLLLQNYQINACPSSVQNNQICAKVLQQLESVHLGLPARQSIASPNRKGWGRTYPCNSNPNFSHYGVNILGPIIEGIINTVEQKNWDNLHNFFWLRQKTKLFPVIFFRPPSLILLGFKCWYI